MTIVRLSDVADAYLDAESADSEECPKGAECRQVRQDVLSGFVTESEEYPESDGCRQRMSDVVSDLALEAEYPDVYVHEEI